MTRTPRSASRWHAAAAACFALGGPPQALAADDVPTLYELRRAGWETLARTERVERRPGRAPYEGIPRVLQVVELELALGTRRLRCVQIYDSQRDHIEERCTELDGAWLP